MKNFLLLLALCLPFKVHADDNIERCMDASYSRILTATHEIVGDTIKIKLKAKNPEDIVIETRKNKNSLEVKLYGTYIARERVLLGKLIELKDMGGWTRLTIKTGKNLTHYKTKGKFIYLSVKSYAP